MSKNLWEIEEKLFGTRSTFKENRLTAKVQNAVTQIVPADPKRLSLIIVNLGNISIFVAPANDVSNAKGILLIGGGGALTLTLTDDFELVSAGWWGICAAPNNEVYILEVISEGKQATK